MASKIDILYEQMKYLSDDSLTRVSLYLDYLYQQEDARKREEPASDCQASVQ